MEVSLEKNFKFEEEALDFLLDKVLEVNLDKAFEVTLDKGLEVPLDKTNGCYPDSLAAPGHLDNSYYGHPWMKPLKFHC